MLGDGADLEYPSANAQAVKDSTNGGTSSALRDLKLYIKTLCPQFFGDQLMFPIKMEIEFP